MTIGLSDFLSFKFDLVFVGIHLYEEFHHQLVVWFRKNYDKCACDNGWTMQDFLFCFILFMANEDC